jgi:hypothetical protein
MTAFYQRINILQEPYSLPDENGLARVAFNFVVVKTESDTFVEEIVARLVAQGVGVFNTNIFVSPSASVPLDRTTLSITESGGMSPLGEQGTIIAQQRPAARILVRASTYVAARAMARAAYDALSVVRNMTLTS